MITELWAENFKSFGKRTTVPLSKLTLLIGPNNAGKSNILEIPKVLRIGVHGQAPDRLQLDGLVRLGELTMHIGARDSEGGGRFSYTLHSGGGHGHRPDGDITHLRERLRNYRVLALDPAVIGHEHGVAPMTLTGDRGQGAAAVLDHMRDLDPKRYEALQSDLRRCAPELERAVSIATGNGTKEIYFEEQGGRRLPCRHVSEGLRFLLFFLMVLHSPEVPAMLAMEDIERGLHPRRIRDVVGFLRQLTHGSNAPQVIVTTHSPLVLDEFRDQPESVVVVERLDGVTSCTRLSEKLAGLQGVGEASLGELWFSGVLGGVPAK